MKDKFSLVAIFFDSKSEVFYKKGKQIPGNKVGYMCSSSVADNEKKTLAIKNEVTLVEHKNNKNIYAKFIMVFEYEYVLKLNPVKIDLIVSCLHDSLAVMRGYLFRELDNTLLKGTIIPTIHQEELLKDVKKNSVGRASTNSIKKKNKKT